MDALDVKLLTALQKDAALSVAALAARVGLSTTPCWRRIRQLEKSGVIRGRVALLDPLKVNLGVEVLVRVKTNRHDKDWLEAFARAVRDIPEILEVHRLTGEIDYLLKIVVPDIDGYDAIYKRLIQKVEFSDVSASIVMERIKSETALPLSYL